MPGPARPETEAERAARMTWWSEARFGLFIHWGLYALPARHEWVRSRERLSDQAYARYFDRFDPDLYDPGEWARTARRSGLKYAVITTKHHDGFCLWDSRLTDYKATRTPAGRDLIKPFVDAMRAEGLRIGFYHSLLDWHHPEYTADRFHPLRDDEAFASGSAGRDMAKYADYLEAQVEELLTGYGRIDTLFFDYSFPGPDGKGRAEWRSERLLAKVRELQPWIIVNDRLDLLDRPGGWDYRSPEQFMPREGLSVDGRPVPWETCQTFSGSWGYDRDESTWKSVRQLVVMLIETVGKGGNLLLNVGPTGRGTFDGRAMDRLRGIGDWLALQGRSIYGCGPAPPDVPVPPRTLLTYHPGRRSLFVHVLEWPPGVLTLEGLAGRVAYAQLLHDASELRSIEADGEVGFMPGPRAGEPEGALRLRLPAAKPDVEVPVIELFLRTP